MPDVYPTRFQILIQESPRETAQSNELFNAKKFLWVLTVSYVVGITKSPVY